MTIAEDRKIKKSTAESQRGEAAIKEELNREIRQIRENAEARGGDTNWHEFDTNLGRKTHRMKRRQRKRTPGEGRREEPKELAKELEVRGWSEEQLETARKERAGPSRTT